MSLINDALKRAKQAQQQNPFGGQPTVPLQPVDYARRPNYFLRSLVALLSLVTLACSGWFFWKWWSSNGGRRSVVVAVTEAKAESAAQSKARPQSSPHKSAIQVSTNIVVRTNVAVTPKPEADVRSAPTNASISTPQTSAAAPAPATGPAAPPSPLADLKLRSIMYREEKPAAVINGEMLHVGDEIRGARVVRIERNSVTVERNGETNELRLPRL
jgi:MSHA biogenesis protein MshK